MKILIVEDELNLLHLITYALMELGGHEVAAAEVGETALRFIQEGFQPDLVILDLRMPGIGGRAVLAQVRMQFPDLPIIITSGESASVIASLMALHDNYRIAALAKPYRLSELEALIEQLK